MQKETHPGPSASSGPPLRGGERSLSPLGRGAALAAGWVLPRPGGHLGRSYRERTHAKTHSFGPYWLSIKKSCRAGGPVLVSLLIARSNVTIIPTCRLWRKGWHYHHGFA